MDNDPGFKLDFSTLIAYLLPGYILQLYAFSLFDLLYIYRDHVQFFLINLSNPPQQLTEPPLNTSLITQLIAVEAGSGALLIAVSLIIAYFAGLIFDMCAHPRTLKEELQTKRKAYRNSFERFSSLIRNEPIKNFLNINDVTTTIGVATAAAEAARQAAQEAREAAKSARDEALRTPTADGPTEAVEISRAALQKADAAEKSAGVAEKTAQTALDAIKPGESVTNIEMFVDAIFYRVAPAEAWSRHNWTWSFYEAARQLTTLTRPRYIWFLFLYLGLIIVHSYFKSLTPAGALYWVMGIVIAVALTWLTWRGPHRSIEEYRSEICEFYHGYKADFVFGHMIQTELIDHQNVSMKLTNVPQA